MPQPPRGKRNPQPPQWPGGDAFRLARRGCPQSCRKCNKEGPALRENHNSGLVTRRLWEESGARKWRRNGGRRRGSENDREKEEISGTQKHIFARTQRKRERVSEYSVTSRERWVEKKIRQID